MVTAGGFLAALDRRACSQAKRTTDGPLCRWSRHLSGNSHGMPPLH